MPSKRLVRTAAIATLALGTVLAVPAAAVAEPGQRAFVNASSSAAPAAAESDPTTPPAGGENDWGWQR
ncbi:hypothetical protein ACIQ7Q_16235 [Streptomyces sp. NPDC096176]|uniref:hypothetical protein n=1 Tax=Streptomyces sp. NPDC096176 TaxID=3366079 RepID=UPI0038055CB6